MRNVAVGSFVTLILFTGLLVSQVEAKNDDNGYKGKNKQEYKSNDDRGKNKQEYKSNDDKGKNKQEYKFVAKNYKFDARDYTHNGTRSVPIPGTLLLLGGGFAGLVAWRARQRKPRA